MSEVTPRVSTDDQLQPRRRTRWWLWFVAGFLLMFVGLAIAIPMPFYDGHAIYDTNLWRYYVLEIRQKLNSSGYLGPTSDNWPAALRVAAVHVLLSAVGGIGLMTIRWFLQRLCRSA